MTGPARTEAERLGEIVAYVISFLTHRACGQDQKKAARAALTQLITMADQPSPEAAWTSASVMPTCKRFVVQSARSHDDDFDDGIHQYDGMWVVEPAQPLTQERWDWWARSHDVFQWFALPDSEVKP